MKAMHDHSSASHSRLFEPSRNDAFLPSTPLAGNESDNATGSSNSSFEEEGMKHLPSNNELAELVKKKSIRQLTEEGELRS
ncbi:Hypothetical predicted protein [Olea europaea subsp. europaea]|uniref:Uncharacterized protein n=1 Tax=Olea europaea subsp. europaea TaxID=158383 RepID=A0A8S0VDN3_OLEEU|nr:Hypothetical predicted protein [Olea europaea subsp. europaea]